ncbi:hypothetical protein ES703_43349 [subsurface metagenome]
MKALIIENQPTAGDVALSWGLGGLIGWVVPVVIFLVWAWRKKIP